MRNLKIFHTKRKPNDYILNEVQAYRKHASNAERRHAATAGKYVFCES